MGCLFLLVDVTALPFLGIPTGRFIDSYPNDISMALGCSVATGQKGIFTLKDLDSIDCDFIKPSATNLLSLKVEECGYVCYDWHHTDWSLMNQSHHHKFRNALFFNESWNIDILCPGRGNCKLMRSISDNEPDEIQNPGIVFFKVQLKNADNHSFFVEEMGLPSIQQIKQVVQCDNDYDISVGNPNFNNNFCRPQCIVRADRRSDICANKEHVTEFQPQLTFWLYLLLRIAFGIASSGSITLFEGACLSVVSEVDGDLGIQRIFGLFGFMIFAPISEIIDFRFELFLTIINV